MLIAVNNQIIDDVIFTEQLLLGCIEKDEYCNKQKNIFNNKENCT